MIPDSKKEEVRHAADIVEVVGDYVQLRKSGSAFTGLCPFHNEKTPSFNVNPQLGIYKCFGCGEGGDVFSFIMKMEGIGFTEALRTLAGRYHVDLPDPELSEEQRRDSTRVEGILHALRFAGIYYHRQLMESEEAGRARGYLAERGYSMAWIRRFGLGYSPSDGGAFWREAVKEGLDEGLLADADLIKPSQRGDGFYDTFRGRLMFPIFNPSGRLIAFAGRILTQEKAAKYVNSAQTPVYNKSQVLYGIHMARQAIRRKEEVLLVEGYTDVMSLHRAGIDHVVASSGTALTEDQVRLIKRYTHRLVMLYDADAAGQSAMLRGLAIALEQGMDVEMLELPKGEDPDSFVRRNGGEGAGEAFLDHRRKHGADFIRFIVRKATSEGRLESLSERTALMEQLLSLIALIPDPVRRQVAIQQAHQATHVFRGGSDRELYQDVDRRIAERRRQEEVRNRFRRGSGAGSPDGVEWSAPGAVNDVAGVEAAGGAGEGSARVRGEHDGDVLPPWSAPHPAAASRIGDEGSGGEVRRGEAFSPDGGPDPEQPNLPGVVAAKRPEAEKALIRLMLLHGEPLSRYVGELINEQFFTDPGCRALYEEIIDRVGTGADISIEAFASGPVAQSSLIADIMMERHSLGESARRHFQLTEEIRKDPVHQVKTTLKPLKLQYLRLARSSMSAALAGLGDAEVSGGIPAEVSGGIPAQDSQGVERRKELLSAMRQIHKEISFLEKTHAEDCFPDPPGYRRQQQEAIGRFEYTPKNNPDNRH